MINHDKLTSTDLLSHTWLTDITRKPNLPAPFFRAFCLSVPMVKIKSQLIIS